ncbi:MAG: Holliday junction branch migration protein RuvA [Anaerolineales bacterium]|jgi:Holliday junction DNA helicase RuvA
MIATLQGEITQIEDNSIIIETGGIGLRVFVPKPLKERLKTGEAIFLFTHLVVRDDDWKLYGFETQADREFFSVLLGVDGVGPRTALAVLSTLNLETVQRAVFSEEPDLLSRVPGVGKKTAQKMILYLHDRLKPVSGLEKIASMTDSDSEVLAALTALGYSVVEAQTAIQSLPKDAPEEVEERLRLALQQFTGK